VNCSTYLCYMEIKSTSRRKDFLDETEFKIKMRLQFGGVRVGLDSDAKIPQQYMKEFFLIQEILLFQ